MSVPLTAEWLRSLMDYEAASGVLTWRQRRMAAGYVHKSGYVVISVAGRKYQAHRLAWLHTYGVWPAHFIDHINGDRADNRLDNLREATQRENLGNRRLTPNTSGLKGVTWHRKLRRWQAQIKDHGRTRYLGLFDEKEKAHAAYMAAAVEIFGDFARAA